MKWIKLFENFSINEIEENNKMANEIVDDIKTISYLLEDEGFDIEYLFNAKSRNFATDLSFRVDEYNKLISSPNISGCKPVNIDMVVVKIIGNSITDPVTFQKVLKKSDIKTIDRYIDLLKEHLDYIDPENITKKKTLMGNMDIIVKL